MKNTLKGINSRLEDAQQMNNLEYRVVEITQAEQQKEKKKVLKTEETVRDICDSIKNTNIHSIHITGVLGGDERKKGTENLFEGKNG